MVVVHGHIGGLLPFFDTLHKLFRWTLFPKSGDSSHIRGYAKNILWFILHQKKGKIDVMDLLYQEIRRSMVDRRRSLVYAPYIQAFIERVTEKSTPPPNPSRGMVFTSPQLTSLSKA